MKVYKFGGASVRSAEGVRNLAGIVSREARGGLFVVVSAMGKTTNALEGVVASFMEGHREECLQRLRAVEEYHRNICAELFGGAEAGGEAMPASVRDLFTELRSLLAESRPEEACYDYWYDRIVSYGELISTRIVATYLDGAGAGARWLDIRSCFITDGRHRDANIDLDASAGLLCGFVDGEAADGPGSVVVTQGFIGATATGETTTLGREGSDYSAAVAAYILGAESLTIWKDVDGILNADPKFFSGTTLIPEMNYLDAIELAYSGAQVIHPKTIKPLKSKNIPLYVRPFVNPVQSGSRISAEKKGRIDMPVLILKKKQVLISVRPHDFSFVLEDRLPEIFDLMRKYNIRMNLIQSSAVSLSLCVDENRQLDRFGDELRAGGFRVLYNEGLELLTIRGYDPATLQKHTSSDGIFLVQKTRHNARIVRSESPAGVCLEI